VVDQGHHSGVHPAYLVAGQTRDQTGSKETLLQARRAKAEISALEDDDLRPEHAQRIADRLGVEQREVIDMDRRLRGDVSLNAPVNDRRDAGDWQDCLVDPSSDPEATSAEREEYHKRRMALRDALEGLKAREREIVLARHAPCRRAGDAGSACQQIPRLAGTREANRVARSAKA
jgi:DNA-directed RNA polymerase sigma subunit (sigma70/sigma32)